MTYGSAAMTYVTTERRLLDAACSDLELKVKGTTARVTIAQPTFDSEGRFRGECRVTVEGQRRFGGKVEFVTPLKVTVADALPGEEAELSRAGTCLVEALTEPEDPAAP
jgi:hypothetical protein